MCLAYRKKRVLKVSFIRFGRAENTLYLCTINPSHVYLRTYQKNITMAIYIKPIPVLTGKVAELFEKFAHENEAKRESVDFTQQREAMQIILERSKQFKIKHGIS